MYRIHEELEARETIVGSKERCSDGTEIHENAQTRPETRPEVVSDKRDRAETTARSGRQPDASTAPGTPLLTAVRTAHGGTRCTVTLHDALLDSNGDR
ncbi:hypothetical protein PsYK624_150220 [Phanerochaete sordida]|uniref:Uncharacterized protein n=1 Tax=Phanerochaete sordida TaxID=48140 RepID=A0A9P3LKR1_9APHY|nr:hypothetical protein PsYK624_150220 [Phanerochaete sordida]